MTCTATAPAPRPAPPTARPPRDLTVDLLRAIAMVAVAVGHWLVVVPSYEDGRFDGVNALATVPLMRPLTWLFQVMPLFFVVGGVANAASWSGARRRGEGYAAWLRTRLVRLVRPAALLFGTWAGFAVLLRAAGVAADQVEPVAWLVVVPVWFLAVYVLVVAVAPALWRAHERWGVRVPVVLAAGAAVVDVVRLADPAGVGEAVAGINFLLVFGVAQQVGFAWYDGRLLRHRGTAWALLGGGLAGLCLLTHAGPFPVSLVGYPGVEVANNAPPTSTLVALGLAQTGLALLARPWLQRGLGRRPVQAFALVMNGNAMSILLWHFTALVVVAVALLPLGIVPDHPEGSGAWWLVRLAGVGLMALVLAPVVAVVGRFERPSAGPVTGPRWAWGPVAAVPLLATACGLITVDGLSGGGPLGLPVLPALLFVGGAGLLLPNRRSDPPAGGGI